MITLHALHTHVISGQSVWVQGVCFLLQKVWGSDSTADQVYLFPSVMTEGSLFIAHNILSNRMTVCQLKNCSCFDASTWKYDELIQELKERGGEVLTPFMLFLQMKSVPPRSVLVYREGLRGRETGFIPHQQHQPRAEPLNLKRHGWFCCSLAALQDPPQTLAKTGSRRARLTVSPPVCLLFGKDRWADIQAPQAAPKEGSLDLQTLTLQGGGGVLVTHEE